MIAVGGRGLAAGAQRRWGGGQAAVAAQCARPIGGQKAVGRLVEHGAEGRGDGDGARDLAVLRPARQQQHATSLEVSRHANEHLPLRVRLEVEEAVPRDDETEASPKVEHAHVLVDEASASKARLGEREHAR